MRNTITSKNGYHVKPVINAVTLAKGYRIDDGAKPLFVAQKRSYSDYLKEKDENECFHLCEVFTTAKGNQFIYWRDEETDADYITPVSER